MNDGEALQRPARHRFIGVPPDLSLRHAGIMLERQRGDRLAVLAAAADAGERDDGADIGAALRQRRDFLRDVEIGFLDADGRGDGIMAGSDSAAGHRREERDLAGAGYRGVRLDMGVVDRGADHLRLLEGVGIGLAAARTASRSDRPPCARSAGGSTVSSALPTRSRTQAKYFTFIPHPP